MPVTLKEIARTAGVSIKTASNVINNRAAHYSQATYERVMQAAEELGYVPNSAARHLRRGKIGAIALVIPHIVNPYYAELSQLIISSAERYDYTVLVDCTNGDRQKEALIVSGDRPLHVDGMLLDSLALSASDLRPGMVRLPIVLLGERLMDAPYDHVVIDNVAAARQAVEHLIALGRRRIAPIGLAAGEPTHSVITLRLAGYRQAMDAAGLPIDPAWLAPRGDTRFHWFDGAREMEHLLALDAPPDAVFCFNDLMALGAIKALQRAGRRVPEDVAVIGLDDVIEASYATPSLSTIAPDKQALSRQALALLMARINGERGGPPEVVHPPFTLRARASTLGAAYAENLRDLPRAYAR